MLTLKTSNLAATYRIGVNNSKSETSCSDISENEFGISSYLKEEKKNEKPKIPHKLDENIDYAKKAELRATKILQLYSNAKEDFNPKAFGFKRSISMSGKIKLENAFDRTNTPVSKNDSPK